VKWIAGNDMEPSATSVILGFAAAIAFAASIGFLNGVLRHRVGVPTFISSLAMMAGLAGVANLITNGTPIESFPSWYNVIGSGRAFNVPIPVYLLGLTFLLAHILTRFTTFGRAIYAVGGNMEAARLSGINVWRTKTLCLVITSVLAAIGGILYSSLIGSGNSTIAKGMELEVISAVIIGGIGLAGGKGTIWGAFIGVLFLGTLLNAMTLWGFNPFWQDVVKGSLILGAVLLNFMFEKRNR
jgi:simple sugar transport system permease protein/ribose transport system permease protein